MLFQAEIWKFIFLPAFCFLVDICLFLSMIKRQIAICLKKRYTFVEVKLRGTESLLPTWAWLCEGLSVQVWQVKDFSVSASQHRVEKCHFAGNIGIYGTLLCNSSGKHVLYLFDVLLHSLWWFRSNYREPDVRRFPAWYTPPFLNGNSLNRLHISIPGKTFQSPISLRRSSLFLLLEIPLLADLL